MRMLTMVVCAGVWVLVLPCRSQPSLSQVQTYPFVQAKKVIEFGWDCPTARWVKANVQSMEQKPFDGVVMWPGSKLITAWQPTDWRNDPAYIDHTSLSTTSFTRFRGNCFLLVWTSDDWALDYWDDALWAKINANQGALAKAAKDYGFAGILFDVEYYSRTSPWGFTDMGRGHTLAQTQTKLRQRGREMMAAWKNSYPDIAILSTYWLNYIPANWELLPHFVNGLLDSIGPGVRMIEGNEESYYWTNTQSFFDRYAGTKVNKESRRAALDPAHELTWDRQVQCGQSAYWDQYMTSNPSDALKKRWEAHFYASLCATDEWVWLWTERMNWWGVPSSEQPIGWNVGITGIYPGAAEGIVNAKAKYAAGQALGWEVMSGQIDSTVKVHISAPDNSASYVAGATINVTVTASGGTISSVDLYANAVKVLSKSSSPYTYALTSVPAGEYTLLARARNSAGRYGMSNPVRVVVKDQTRVTRGPGHSTRVRAAHPSSAIGWDLRGRSMGRGVTDVPSLVITPAGCACRGPRSIETYAESPGGEQRSCRRVVTDAR